MLHEFITWGNQSVILPMPKGVMKKGTVRLCRSGYSCGDTCISKKKVCLKKLGTNRASQMARRFSQTLKATGQVAGPKKSQPDLITDV